MTNALEEAVADPVVNQRSVDRAPVCPDREQLILDHLPQVRLIARRIHERLPASIGLEDLISAGIIGLIAAIDRFDFRRDVKLKTYAEYKIRGAILDSLRGLDWAPRRQRRQARLIQGAVSFLEQKLQRTPNEPEIAGYLGLPLSTYQDWLGEARCLTLGSFESASNEASGFDLLRFVADDGQPLPSEILERSELERTLALAIERMPKSERIVMNLYFFEERTLREIAEVLDLHESRISQLKTQAILRLRSAMQKRWPAAGGPKRS